LRELLRESEPRDFPLKKAWRAMIRAARAHRREGGDRLEFSSLAQVERALGTVPSEPEVAARIKPLLRSLHRGEAGPEAAVEIDRQLRAALPSVYRGLVGVEVTGWPDGFDSVLRSRLLRREAPPPYMLPAEQAAAVQREFHGMVIAGAELSVALELPVGHVLPPVPRSLRARPQPRGRKGPWLPYWDEQGRRFLTPELLAMRTAAELRERGVERVIDGCAGLGGNSIAFVRAGLSVVAVEADPRRMEMAQRNAGALRCGQAIEWHCGRIEELLPGLSGDALFLDPPWQRAPAALPPWLPLPSHLRIVIKAPADFDPTGLPGDGWKLQFEFGEASDDESVLKMLTVWRL